MNIKSNLGQFYTTNYKYILQSFYIPDNINNIIEPFCGNGDLIKYIDDINLCKKIYNIDCYDIDPKKSFIIKRDTLLEPPNYNNTFIITNPPYLAKNKSTNKELFNLYNTNDLYKCFIEILIKNPCNGGILIVPLNFICSIRPYDIELRKRFIDIYNILLLNIFEEKVFNDTSYTICSFQFINKKETINSDYKIIKCSIFPSNKKMEVILSKYNNYTIGGDIYNIIINKNYKIDRATRLTKNKDYITNILLKCIDDNINSKIQLKIINDIDKDKFVDNTIKLSARSYAIIVIEPFIDLNKQKELVIKFNNYLNTHRDKYNSLFLTNYRDSNSIARKRISFNLAFQICGYLLN